LIEERSAGTVIYRNTPTGMVFLLLHYPSGHWDFVKGKMEEGELPHETVIREAKEETKISDLEFVDNFEENIEYNFQHEGTLIHKKVVFFLARTKTEKIIISHEHLDHVWLSFEQAYEKTTFENAKNILLKANKLLTQTL
jgi:8-oxo-dGTP pyrophosphatase MutT (NUDIX family)